VTAVAHSRRVAVLLAPGFEEIEAITAIDVLRRAGVQVTVVGLVRKRVQGSHGITVEVDGAIDDQALIDVAFDAVVLPGGMPGATALRDSASARAFVEAKHKGGTAVAAICAAPIALAAWGLLQGKDAACYPGFEDALRAGGASTSAEAVVVDGAVITSRGVGTALSFALRLVAILVNEEAARDLARRMLTED
jgi:4-methyl-5(b-hydroxyethyl)-thiazole monophosphate biosynthesis